MGDSLLSSRHYRVVCSNDDDGNIRYLSTTSTHSREGLVTRSVEEGNLTAILQLHIIGTDVLGDTSCLTGNHVRITDMVEQRGLTMVDMTHHRHNRSTSNEIVLIVLLLSNGVLYLSTYIFCCESKLFGNDIDRLSIQTLVNGNHDTNAHTSTDDLIHAYVHHGGELGNSHKLCQLQHLAFCCLRLHLLLHALCNGITLLTTVFGTLLILVLGSQTGQCLLHLTGYSLIVNLKRLLDGAVLLILLTTLLVATILEVLVAAFILILLIVLSLVLIGSSLDIHAFLTTTDTLALLLFTIAIASVHLGLLFLTLLTTLLLRLLLRTGALVQ